MKRGLPPYVYQKPAGVYFQRRGWPTVRIMAQPGTPEFALEYAAILNGARPAVAPTERTFSALVKSYVASDRYRDRAPRTRQDYDRVLEWVKAKIGHLPVDSLQRKDVIRARDANAESVRFANYIVQVLRILMEHAIDLGWVKENHAKGASLLKSKRPPREPWPADMIEAYRGEATGRPLLIFELCLGTGQRIGDVLKMRWSDVRGDGINVKQAKTGAELWIPFTSHLRSLLAQTPRVGATICAWGMGKPTTYIGAADMVRLVRRKIGAEAYDLHSLRYSATAELAEAGCSDELIMAITGHTTHGMVARYAGKARQMARAKEAQKRRETERE